MLQPNKVFSGLEHKLNYYPQILAEHPQDVLPISNLCDDLQKGLAHQNTSPNSMRNYSTR